MTDFTALTHEAIESKTDKEKLELAIELLIRQNRAIEFLQAIIGRYESAINAIDLKSIEGKIDELISKYEEIIQNHPIMIANDDEPLRITGQLPLEEAKALIRKAMPDIQLLLKAQVTGEFHA